MIDSKLLDNFDWRILDALQNDGRLSIVDLGERIGLSSSPCHRRVRRLEDEGIIHGYSAQLDRLRLGLQLTIFMEIKVDGHKDENARMLQQAIIEMPEVIACHIVSGTPDFLLELVVPDLATYERLLFDTFLKMPMIKDIQSNFSIRAIKTGGQLPINL